LASQLLNTVRYLDDEGFRVRFFRIYESGT
jgi:hypothetical protein